MCRSFALGFNEVLQDRPAVRRESIVVEPIAQNALWPPSKVVPALPIWHDDVAGINEQLRRGTAANSP